MPLPAVVLDALAAHLAEHPATVADGLMFTTDAGEPIRRTRFSDVWRPAVQATGSPAGTSFHDLRHYYASLLIRHGESVKVVQARLGHASATETLDTYSHLSARGVPARRSPGFSMHSRSRNSVMGFIPKLAT